MGALMGRAGGPPCHAQYRTVIQHSPPLTIRKGYGGTFDPFPGGPRWVTVELVRISRFGRVKGCQPPTPPCHAQCGTTIPHTPQPTTRKGASGLWAPSPRGPMHLALPLMAISPFGRPHHLPPPHQHTPHPHTSPPIRTNISHDALASAPHSRVVPSQLGPNSLCYADLGAPAE